MIVDERDGEGRIVSWGYHRRYGGPHAEAEALKKAGGAARGCSVYVNLEPCCHTGKTPPCANALIDAGVASVIIGTTDPNPRVSGGGAAALREVGIEVVTGVLEDECRWLNRGFIRNMTMGRPWVTVKAAMSLDGNMALQSGESKWISSAASRKRAHLLRAENDAIMVGVGTVMQDDPMLTVRDVEGRAPLKVIVDRSLRTPTDAKVLDHGKCVFFTGPSPDEERVAELEKRGAKIVRQRTEENGYIPFEDLFGTLSALGVNHLMVEGGPKLIDSLIRCGSVDEYSLFVAPKLLGAGLNMTNEISFRHMDEAIQMKRVKIRQVGNDIWFEGVPSCSPAL